MPDPEQPSLLPTEWEDIERLPGPRLTERIHDMYRLFGRGPAGARCKTCANFYALHYAGTYYKCKLNTNTGGPASDWRANWQACGKYEQREEAS